MTTVTVMPVEGIPEVTEGADLAGLIAGAATGLADGDILVVTSKIVSKAEGRVVHGDREKAIDAETVRVVARRGATRIVETRHGLVLAAAGVDASNTPPGTARMSAPRALTSKVMNVTIIAIESDDRHIRHERPGGAG